MAFRLRNEARDWFSEIAGEFGKGAAGIPEAPMFDMYYLCLVAGLAELEPSASKEVTTTSTAELVSAFPGEYRERGRLIIALLLSRELRRTAVELTERDALHETVSEYVDPQSPSGLSSEGEKLSNRYAYNGFEIMASWFDAKPQHLETFLLLYAEKVKAAAQQ